MLRSIQQRDLDRNRWVKITMSVILLIICVTMVITLVPGLGGFSGATNPDSVATVGGQDIGSQELQQQLDQQTRGASIPQALKGLYARQVLDQMIFQRALEIEAQRLGIRVTPQEETERIKQILPGAWSGDTWLKDRYVSEVQTRTGMSVPQFETIIHDGMLQEKFRQLVTDGITVTPQEIQQEFRRRNEKVQIEYALIKPSEIAATIHPSDSELAAYFAKNSSRYQVPEMRSARYALLDLNALRQKTRIPDSDIEAYYNSHLDQYKVEDRAHVEHILFKTIGKTDAEVTEIRQQAEDVLNKIKHGANFEDMAKKYSEDDATKPKGGDLGWIVKGQTVPAFQQAAFSLPKGTVSDLVKTEYGFHIIKVLDRETAHTKPLAEVRDQIVPLLLNDKMRQQSDTITDQMAAAVRQSNRQSLDDIARKFNLTVGVTPPAPVTAPVGVLGSSPEVHQVLFQLRPGELSEPISLENGVAILTVKDIQPAHQGALAEVHDRVLSDFQQDKSLELARQKADELSREVQSGQPFDKAAQSLDLTTKTPDAFARTGSVPDVGAATFLDAAFTMPVGQVSKPTSISGDWLVYRVVSHQPANPVELATQTQDIESQLMQSKQTAAFDAFHTALEDSLRKEGKITINADIMKRFTKSG